MFRKLINCKLVLRVVMIFLRMGYEGGGYAYIEIFRFDSFFFFLRSSVFIEEGLCGFGSGF